MQITGFRSESHGLVIDLQESQGAVILNRESGDALLKSAISAGQSAPESVSGDRVLDVEGSLQDDGRIEVRLSFRGDDGSVRTVSLGSTDNVDAVRGWIEEAKSVIAKRERKPRLNPTVDHSQAKPVPSIGASASQSDPSSNSNHQPVPNQESKQQQSETPPPPPVDLPPKQEIDSDLEQELEAAMAGQMAVVTTPKAEGEPPAPGSATPATTEDELQPGAKLKAKVQSLSADDVFCDVGFRSPGVLPARQFPQGKQPRVGEEFLVIFENFDPEHGVLHVNLPKATRRAKGNWEELTVGQVTECMVNKTNKGGLEVSVGGLRAFLPTSQVELGFTPNLDSYVGQKLTVQVTEVNPAKRNLVVSRRALLIAERKELAETFWQKVEVGQQFPGKVKTIKDYGAFVDLGGADGFLHIGEMSWTRVKHPSEVLQEGGSVEVVVLSLDREKKKIGLGMRQLAPNPWALVEANYSVGKNVSGIVTRVADFGAFVELEKGVEGLIHISELDHQRIRKVSDVVSAGQSVQAQVLEVDTGRQRISLSLKALKAKPEKPKDEDLSPGQGAPYERKHKGPLRGGTSSGGGGGLFGNPNDFGK